MDRRHHFLSSMTSLRKYLQSLIEYDEANYIKYEGGVHNGEINRILDDILVEPNTEIKQIPSILVSKAEFCYHVQIIDLVLEYMINKNINNVLLEGIERAEYVTSSNASIYTFKGYNSTIILLHSKAMQAIRQQIGNKHFINLLLNSKCVFKSTNLLLWGDIKPKDFTNTKKKERFLSISRMLHVHPNAIRGRTPIPESSWNFMFTVFYINGIPKTKRKNDPPKRFRKVYKLAKLLISNHKENMLKYPYIFDQICHNNGKSKNSNNLSLTVDKHMIIKFVMTIVYMIFPLEFFGTNKNRTKIMRIIPQLINGTIYQKIELDSALNKIKLNDICWLKPVNELNMTKLEFLRARELFKSFLFWFFNNFICKLISSFFHVTEASQDVRPLFFKHHVWSRISKKFMSKYFTRHLVNQKDKNNSFKSLNSNIDMIGKLALQPKKSSFRLIVKPFKGNQNEKALFYSYQKKILRPINKILFQIRDNQSCNSLPEIVNRVYEFKNLILKKHCKLPTIYAFKFDVQNAYDSLPHSIIDKCVRNRLDNYTENDRIHTHLFYETKESEKFFKKRYVVSDSLKNVTPPKVKKADEIVMIDTHQSYSFTKDEIMEFVRSQYMKTCFHTKNRSYYRKIGVFQGYPLSGTLFNIVYDSFLIELNQMLKNHSETKIIRLMDDFLVLSTDLAVIRSVKKLIARSVKEFNLNANRLKTEFTTKETLFAGIHIDVENLICYKLVSQYNCAPIQVSSFSKLYSSLLKYADIWIGNKGLFDPSCNNSELNGSRKNLSQLLKSILYKFVNSYKMVKLNDSFNINKFNVFIKLLIRNIDNHISLKKLKFNSKLFYSGTFRTLKYKGILHKSSK